MATGAAVDVVMPQMGVSVSEGTVTRWLRNVGDRIAADEPLLEISTDKVDTEVPSPGAGVLQEILVQEGETVPVGTLVARIGADGGATAPEVLSRRPEPEPEPGARSPRPSRSPEPAAGGGRAEAPRSRRSRRHRPGDRPRPDKPAGTGPLRANVICSSRRSSRESPPSTASTRRPSPARGATAASPRRTSLPSSSLATREGWEAEATPKPPEAAPVAARPGDASRTSGAAAPPAAPAATARAGTATATH